jgi:hypothetical protein
LLTTALNRLGNVGLLMVACALLVGGLAGAALAHHYDVLSADTIATHQDDKGKGAQKPKHQHGNQKHANQGGRQGAQGDDPAGTD